jgi:hypothetical protein
MMTKLPFTAGKQGQASHADNEFVFDRAHCCFKEKGSWAFSI